MANWLAVGRGIIDSEGSAMTLAFRSMRWNSWRWRPVLEKWGHLRILIDPALLKTAAFLWADGLADSTVFFVRWPRGDMAHSHYAVTTAHSIQYDKVEIKFNLKRGGIEPQQFLPGDWTKSLSTDIAVMVIDHLPLSSYDIEYVDVFDFAGNKDYLKVTSLPETLAMDLRYGTGDEVFSIGLFQGHTGQETTQPAARFGHIALRPAEGEKISAEICKPLLTPINAFLIEQATWRGQSGSPVFLHKYWYQDTVMMPPYLRDKDYLIGMVQGFYPGGSQDVKINEEDFELSGLQMGIGIVIPAQDIVEALMQPKEQETRDKLKNERQQNPRIRPASASVKQPPPVTKKSFEDMLKQVSRKASEPES